MATFLKPKSQRDRTARKSHFIFHPQVQQTVRLYKGWFKQRKLQYIELIATIMIDSSGIFDTFDQSPSFMRLYPLNICDNSELNSFAMDNA